MDDHVRTALVASWESMCAVRPAGWSRRGNGFVVGVTAVPVPTLNGVFCWDRAEEPLAIDAALDEVASTGLPHSVQFPVGSAQLTAVAERRGMTRAEDAPLMRLDGDPGPIGPSRMVVRELGWAEASVHARVAAAGFDTPVDVFEMLLEPMTGLDDVLILVGELDGVPVTTGLGWVHEDAVGVFNIATPPGHRGLGYGSQITAAVIRRGHAAGASWAWLQSSPQGLGAYRRLGFSEVDNIEVWVAPGPA